MKDNLSRYTLRIDQTILDKLGYIAEYEGRTKNRELEQMIKIQFCFVYEFPAAESLQRGFVISWKQPKALDLKGFQARKKSTRDPKSRWTHGGVNDSEPCGVAA